jgi:uncharacterized protein YfdQ (DUF2303 family)
VCVIVIFISADAKGEKMKTAKKDELDSQTEQLLRKRLTLEYKVYHGVKERFYLLHNAIRTLKTSNNQPRLVT